MNRWLGVSLLFLATSGTFVACGEDSDDGGSAGASGSGTAGSGTAGSSATDEATLSKIQSDIFTKSCAFGSCHGSAGLPPNLTDGQSHASLIDKDSQIESGKKYVVPGKPDESLLYQVIQGSVGSISQMPKGNKLTPAQIEMVKKWIEAGAKND
jgi:mono/diheme cytochrome c family protein